MTVFSFSFQCDAVWSTHVYDTYKEYVDGKTTSSTTGFGIDMGPVVSGEYNSSDKDKDSDKEKDSESRFILDLITDSMV